ncbi:MAG: hypothetical protein JXQ73_12490 [Phycisphaerae bacterium]|nr:hypothetical protein [Phycisphaerae bacterium]
MNLPDLFAESLDVPPPPDDFDVKQLPAHGGVWLLADEYDRPIQLGGSESVRRTIAFRFANPELEEEKRRAKVDVRSITRKIWWWPTYSQFETAFDYHRIARQLYPDDYLERVAFGPCWFIRVDPDARIPRFTPTQKVFAAEATYFGPFTSRAQCSRYVEVLQELFGLCRCLDVLDQTPNGRRCAYYDMGKCAAPCDGSSSLDDYRAKVADAVDLVRTGPDELAHRAESEMRQAAAAQEFEIAAAAKRRMEEARKLQSNVYRFVTLADRFNWLIVQRGGSGRSKVKPFFVRSGWIDRGEPVALKKLDEHVEAWIRDTRQPSPSSLGDDAKQRAEHVWLVSHFLFRSEKVPGLFLPAAEIAGADDLSDRVRAAFPAPAREPRETQAPEDGQGVEAPPDAG